MDFSEVYDLFKQQLWHIATLNVDSSVLELGVMGHVICLDNWCQAH